jgi:hypothetical protein
LKTLIGRAFSPQAVFVYAAGFVVFAVIPYFLLLKPIPVKKPWIELAIFVARLVMIFLLTLFGWVVTIGALALSGNARLTGETNRES